MATGCGGYTDVGSDISADNGGTDVSSLYSSPAELGVGDFMVVEFNSASPTSMDFAGVSEDAKFILAVGSAGENGGSSSINLHSSISLPDPLSPGKSMSVDSVNDEDDGYEANEIFSAWLRASEVSLDESELPADYVSAANFKGMSMKAVGLGERETFRVLGSLTNTNSYVNVDGQVKCVGQSVVFYVDTSVPAEILPAGDVQTLCNDFDANVSDMEGFLGLSSDVDADGKLHVLMTSQINKLGALGGGVITGYFYAADLYARSDSNPASNQREIIYTMVPDPNGQYGMPVEYDFAMDNLLPAVLPHEFQHAINYNQHVLVGGGAPEENWLNEGMSHLIEDVMGWGRENPSRYALYLASPSTYGLVTQFSPNLMERGGAYLFLRYLYEQASDGDAFLGRLVQTNKRGVENVISAFNGDAGMDEWSEMLARWSVALIMTNRGISQDSRYIYKARSQHPETGNWEGVILEGDADDGRGTVLEGVNLNSYNGSNTASVDGSTAKYYRISSVPDKVDLTGSSVSTQYAVLVRYQ
jgi:hypothetical protein